MVDCLKLLPAIIGQDYTVNTSTIITDLLIMNYKVYFFAGNVA